MQSTIAFRFSFWATVVVLAIRPRVLAAQFRADSVRQDLRNMVGDIWSVWTSPVHTTANDMLGVAPAVGLTGAAATFDQRLERWIKNHPEVWPVRTLRQTLSEEARYPVYELGSGQFLLPLSGALYLAGSLGHSRSLRDAGLGCATAHLTSAGAREIVYLLIARDRPRLSPEDPFRIGFPGSSDWDEHSFFSGHIANSLGCASFLSHRFDLHAGSPLLYGFTMLIGAGRLLDGRHWLSDTVAGGLFGYAAGKAIAARMLARERTPTTALAPPSSPLTMSFSIPFD